MLLETFKNFVDNHNSIVTETNSDLYNEISDTIYTKELTDKNSISRFNLMNLRKELIYRYILFNENPIIYLQVLSVINDSCRNKQQNFIPFEDTELWNKGIAFALKFLNNSPTTFSLSEDRLRRDYPKDFDVGISAKKLRQLGCEISIINSEIEIVNGLNIVTNKLDANIKAIGGLVVLRSLFNNLQKRGLYSDRFERYFITRETSFLGFTHTPQIPYGYLLNLALKYPFENKPNKHTQKILNEIIDLSITITNGVYSTECYSTWEYVYQSDESIISFLTKTVLWDTLFSIPQSKGKIVSMICENLFNFIDESAFCNIIGVSQKDLLLVYNEVLKLSSSSNSVCTVYLSTISKNIKSIDKKTIQIALDFLSHQHPPNKTYTIPSEFNNVDFWQKPLLKIGGTKYLLPFKSWSNSTLYDAILTCLKSNKHLLPVNDIDIEIGYKIEQFVHKKLQTQNIQFLSGKYRDGKIDGECDTIIETSKAIIIIEIKKKPLTAISKSGSDNNLILDLTKSVLDAQYQSGKVELILKQNNQISVTDSYNKSHNIYLNNREIIRVALTLNDFGGLHDRHIFTHYLKLLLTHSLHTNSTESKIIKAFNELDSKREKWLNQYNALCEIDSNYNRNFLMFGCFFINVPQLLEVIHLSNCNDSFYEILTKTRYVTLGTLDWYKEFDLATKTSA